MGSYIKIDRKILEWEWYKNLNTCRLFFHILLKANWKDCRFEGREIRRGSFVTSVRNLSLETALTEDEVRTALGHLIKTGEVTKQTTNKYTVITVSNYEPYQDIPKQKPDSYQTDAGQLPDSNQTIPKLFPTIEEEKERKEREEKDISSGDGGDSIYNIHTHVCAEAGKLLGEYWGMRPSGSDIEGVRSRIVTVWDGKPAVDKDREDLLEYAFACSANANARNWNYVQGVLDRLAARGIRTAGEAYRRDAGRDMGDV